MALMSQDRLGLPVMSLIRILLLTNDPTRYDFEFGQVMSVIEKNA